MGSRRQHAYPVDVDSPHLQVGWFEIADVSSFEAGVF